MLSEFSAFFCRHSDKVEKIVSDLMINLASISGGPYIYLTVIMFLQYFRFVKLILPCYNNCKWNFAV